MVQRQDLLTSDRSHTQGWNYNCWKEDDHGYPILSRLVFPDEVIAKFLMPEEKFPTPDHSPPSTLILLDMKQKSMKKKTSTKNRAGVAEPTKLSTNAIQEKQVEIMKCVAYQKKNS